RHRWVDVEQDHPALGRETQLHRLLFLRRQLIDGSGKRDRRLALTFYVRKDDARTRRLIFLLALRNGDRQPAGDRKHTGATFLDRRQFNVAEKPRPARLPEKFELERI